MGFDASLMIILNHLYSKSKIKARLYHHTSWSGRPNEPTFINRENRHAEKVMLNSK